ncbi:MAG TPA: hypothetical protein VMG38_04830 [Trebonia sp.]|nr:hypothetical protein [Trebonia sp.]
MSTPASPRLYPDVLYYQRQHRPARPRRPRGRWIWAISGVIVICVIIAGAGTVLSTPRAIHALPMSVATRTVTISKAVTSLSVQSYGGDVRVTGGGKSARVTEQIGYDPQQGAAAAVTDTVSHGQLSMRVPSCAFRACTDWITVPSDVFVSVVSEGGNVAVSGVAGASLDSGGGGVTAISVSGPLTVTSAGGEQGLQDIGGSLMDESGGNRVVAADITGSSAVIITDGGRLTAKGLSVKSAIISTGGNDARLAFATAPASADITTDGGMAEVVLPGGPYALTADSEGGSEVVAIPTSPAAKSTLDVTTGGNSLVVRAASSSQVSTNVNPAFLPDPYAVPVAPPARPAPAAP